MSNTIKGISGMSLGKDIRILTAQNHIESSAEWKSLSEPIDWHVSGSITPTEYQKKTLDDFLKEMHKNPNLAVEIQFNNGEVLERRIKKHGSKMVSKIDRNKAYARPIVYYVEEFYCKF